MPIVAWWHQAINWTNTDFLLVSFYGIHHNECSSYDFLEVWKFLLLKLQLHLLGDNQLMSVGQHNIDIWSWDALHVSGAITGNLITQHWNINHSQIGYSYHKALNNYVIGQNMYHLFPAYIIFRVNVLKQIYFDLYKDNIYLWQKLP